MSALLMAVSLMPSLHSSQHTVGLTKYLRVKGDRTQEGGGGLLEMNLGLDPMNGWEPQEEEGQHERLLILENRQPFPGKGGLQTECGQRGWLHGEVEAAALVGGHWAAPEQRELLPPWTGWGWELGVGR